MADKDKNTPNSSKSPSTVNADASSSSKPPPRVIGNFTTQTDASRIGPSTTRMKFTPNMPVKKNQPEDTLAKPTIQATTAPASSSTHAAGAPPGRTRGTTRGRGRGAGRGDGPKYGGAQVEMVPVGPFAMGPVAAGMAGTSRSAANVHTSSGGGPGVVRGGVKPSDITSGAKGGGTALPQNRDTLVMDNEAHEIYSDDEGVAIIDLEDVKALDYMAPDALKRERRKNKGKGKQKAKKEPGVKPEIIDTELHAEEGRGEAKASPVKNESQALDLSESGEEIELEDLQQHFQIPDDGDGFHQDQFYFFQFPDNFPIFEPPYTPSSDAEADVVEADTAEANNKVGKKVAFAQDVKSGTSGATSGATTPQPRITPRIEGLIGQLEIRRSGICRHTTSFLQQAVTVDLENKRISVLGSVTQRFVCTPDIDVLTNSKQETMDLDLS
ncbi:SubName: Full=Related to RPC53-47 kD subunit of DNA-directed RNA polymerase III {ECO:0000313/EMBL:CCA69457.1} [Serendipita indica DSM 11827]|nr:SubName: Full=Related to RPC53-47 kD subunit of DNA-directed RNA polymerase III {ECO:0000313/EMBL:CCA69457.1} [Serendipita indica DSM 11827]